MKLIHAEMNDQNRAGQPSGKQSRHCRREGGTVKSKIINMTDKQWQAEHPTWPVDFRALGRIGGAKSTDAKRAASRENGKKGGRPRKSPLTPPVAPVTVTGDERTENQDAAETQQPVQGSTGGDAAGQ